MSKKSRKRNKKILAAIGLGLGAAAMASRKKADLASTEDGKSGSTKITGGTNSNDYDSGTKKTTAKKTTAKKPDSKMPGNLSKNTGKDNTKEKIRFGQVKVGNKKTDLKPFRTMTLGIPEGSKPLQLKDNTLRAKNRLTSSGGIQEPNKPMLASLILKGKTADNYKADMRDFRKSSQYGATTRDGTQMKSGGRAGLRSGGKVKGCGKALRGFGKAMKGKR